MDIANSDWFCFRTPRSVRTFLLFTLASTAIVGNVQGQSQPFQFNVIYSCPNSMKYKILSCTGQAGDDLCLGKFHKTGGGIFLMQEGRQKVTALLQTCQVLPAATGFGDERLPPLPSDGRYSCIPAIIHCLGAGEEDNCMSWRPNQDGAFFKNVMNRLQLTEMLSTCRAEPQTPKDKEALGQMEAEAQKYKQSPPANAVPAGGFANPQATPVSLELETVFYLCGADVRYRLLECKGPAEGDKCSYLIYQKNIGGLFNATATRQQLAKLLRPCSVQQIALRQPAQTQVAARNGTGTATAAKSEAMSYLALGEKYFAAKDYTSAVEAFKKALVINPSLADAYMEMGTTYYQQKEYELAADAYRKYVTLKPGDALGFILLGNMQRDSQHYLEAVQNYQNAIRLKPETKQLGLAYLQLGRTYASWGKRDEALEAYKELQNFDKAKAQELLKEIKKTNADPPSPGKPAAQLGAAGYATAAAP